MSPVERPAGPQTAKIGYSSTDQPQQHPLRTLWRQGFSVFPIAAGQKDPPLVRWAEYQHRRPTPVQIEEWLARWPQCNAGIATGPVSRLVVIDVDPRHGGHRTMQAYPPLAATVRTGSGGSHIYLRVPDAIPSRNGWLPGVDLKGVGGYVVAPGSVHPSGGRYRWVGPTIKAVPEWLRAILPAPASDRGGVAVALAVGGVCSPSLPFETPDAAPAFITQLRNVQHITGGWRASCPAHTDADPSLVVRVLVDGRPWVRCFAGCRYQDVMAALTDPAPVDPGVWDRMAATRRGRTT
jgi:hypothetical protein